MSAPAGPTTREELLAEINRDLPPGVDWKAGARRYLAAYFEKFGREPIERYSLTKPFGLIGTGGNAEQQLREVVEYLHNFTNAIELLEIRHGTRVLDVACGGGWVSHFLSKLGCITYGFDISEDFIGMARRRLREDRTLHLPAEEAERRFFCLDIEASPLPEPLRGSFDIVWLESCLHHLQDPVTALTHLAGALKPDGVVLVIEGENRRGAIKDDYMRVMRETETIERPYSREHLVAALAHAGLPHVEFMGRVNGWFRKDDLPPGALQGSLVESQDGMNLALCAKRPGILSRYFRTEVDSAPVTFGSGFFPNESGFRWCGPVGEIQARIPQQLHLDVRSELPARNARPQVIGVYGEHGLVESITLDGPDARKVLQLELSAGERLTLCSSDAYRPSPDGQGDQRLLSFYLKTDY